MIGTPSQTPSPATITSGRLSSDNGYWIRRGRMPKMSPPVWCNRHSASPRCANTRPDQTVSLALCCSSAHPLLLEVLSMLGSRRRAARSRGAARTTEQRTASGKFRLGWSTGRCAPIVPARRLMSPALDQESGRRSPQGYRTSHPSVRWVFWSRVVRSAAPPYSIGERYPIEYERRRTDNSDAYKTSLAASCYSGGALNVNPGGEREYPIVPASSVLMSPATATTPFPRRR